MKKYSVFIVALFVLLLSQCVHEVPVVPGTDTAGTPTTPVTPASPAVGKTCSADSVYFSNDVLPLVVSNCSMTTCHGGQTGPTLLTYSQISKNRGDIIDQLNTGQMPRPPIGLLTTAQIALFKKWVNQGFKNNACSATCDTTKYTFTVTINPLMKKYCVGCHTGGTSANKNVDLSTYAGVKASALSGQLYKSVAHLAGAIAMPPSGTALSTCEVTQIKKWIAAGALN